MVALECGVGSGTGADQIRNRSCGTIDIQSRLIDIIRVYAGDGCHCRAPRIWAPLIRPKYLETRERSKRDPDDLKT